MSEALKHDLGEAIAEVLNKHEPSVVTKWIVLVEAVDGEGDRCLWTLGSDTLRAWDGFGMLTYAAGLEQAKLVARQIETD